MSSSRELSQSTTDGHGSLPMPTPSVAPISAWCGTMGPWKDGEAPVLMPWTLRSHRNDAIRAVGEAFALPGQTAEQGWRAAKRHSYRVVKVLVSPTPGDGAGHGTASTLGNSGRPKTHD